MVLAVSTGPTRGGQRSQSAPHECPCLQGAKLKSDVEAAVDSALGSTAAPEDPATQVHFVPHAVGLAQAVLQSRSDRAIQYVLEQYRAAHPQFLVWQRSVGCGLWESFPKDVQSQNCETLRRGTSGGGGGFLSVYFFFAKGANDMSLKTFFLRLLLCTPALF